MKQETFLFNKVGIVGVGLLGGSIAAAMQARGIARQCIGIDRSTEHLATAKERGWINATGNLDAETLSTLDLLILCTPVATLPGLFAQAIQHLPTTAIITDVGSTKKNLISAVAPLLQPGQAIFVPAHPIAGSQHSGPLAADPHLFEDKPVILTPLADTPSWAIRKLKEFWTTLGGWVVEGSPEWHDTLCSEVSHTPHLLAFLAVDLINQHPEGEQLWALAGTGLRDFTRIGAGNPEIWRDITLDNRDAILGSLYRYREGLNTMIANLENREGETLYKLFSRAQQARQKRWP